MVKKIVFGISCVTLAFSLVWAYKTQCDWEPLIVLAGSIVGVLSSMNFGIRSSKLVGTWTTIVQSPLVTIEEVCFYKPSGEYESVVRILRYPEVHPASRLTLALTGEYKVKEGRLYHSQDNTDIIYSYAYPDHIIKLILATLISHDTTQEIISISSGNMKTKTADGIILSSNRVSQEIDSQFIEDFIKVDEKK